MLVAEHSGDTMPARIGVIKALHRKHQELVPTLRKKHSK
jgi:hypothetical protein